MIYSTEHNTHTQQESGLGYSSVKKHWLRGLPWWASGLDSALPMQGAQVQSLLRELDPTCCNIHLYQTCSLLVLLLHRSRNTVQFLSKSGHGDLFPSLLPSPSRELWGFAKTLAGVRAEPTLWPDLNLNSVLFDQPFLGILTTCQAYAKCRKNRNKWDLASVCGSWFNGEHRCGVTTMRSSVRETEHCGNVPAGPVSTPLPLHLLVPCRRCYSSPFSLGWFPSWPSNPIPRSSSLESFPDSLPSNLFSQSPTLVCLSSSPFLTLGYV